MNIKYFIINMDEFPEKYTKTKNELYRVGIQDKHITRKKAINGKKIPKPFLKKITHPSVFYYLENERKLHDQIPTLGGIGCYLSHSQLLEQLVEEENDDTIYAIIEDDIKTNCSENEYKEYLSNLPLDWEFCFLGYLRQLNVRNKKNKMINDYYQTVEDVLFGTHFYLVNKKGAKKLLEFLYPIIQQIDIYVTYINLYKDMNTYKSNKNLFQQNNESPSTIQNVCVPCVLNEINFEKWIYYIILIIFLIILIIFLRKSYIQLTYKS